MFVEMHQELFYKISLLRNTEFFNGLSPYALVVIASNVEVREYSYGEPIVKQGEVPESCLVLAYGRCKSLYEYEQKTCTRINDYAKKILRADRLPKPMAHG